MAMPERRGAISLERIIDETLTVYSLPCFYERLNEAINHPKSSITDIAHIISEDHGLTARLLKLANSPMFGYYSRIESISRAVTIIGTQPIRDLALAVSVMDSFRGIPQELMSMESFWRHGISSGIIARNLAIYLHERNVERFFVAGILHDIGQLILCTAIPEQVRSIILKCGEYGMLYSDGEKELLDFDHGDVGMALLSRWKIPASIQDPVAFHHRPSVASRFPLETVIIHLADIISHAMEFGRTGERLVPPLDEAAWERITIPVNALPAILKQSEAQLEDVFTILTRGV